jgi:DNA invertase Pin-like site-specific DNA recombinase
MFGMMGVFAEFERSIIQERVRAGLLRSKREGKRLGRPPIADEVQERIRAALAGGMSVRKAAARFKINPSTVQNLKRPFVGAGIAERAETKAEANCLARMTSPLPRSPTTEGKFPYNNDFSFSS